VPSARQNSIIKEERYKLMKKVTKEQIKNLNLKELLNISKAILDETSDSYEYSDEKKQIIFEQLRLLIERTKDIREVLQTSKRQNHPLFPEQYEALEAAYEADDAQDWVKCRSALEVFFEYEIADEFEMLTPGNWNYRHLMRWFEMFVQTRLCDEPEDEPARIFYLMITKKVMVEMSPELKPAIDNIFNGMFPEVAALFDNSTSYAEDGQKCIKISDAAEALGMSEEEIIESFDATMEPDKFLVPEDKTHTLQ
jgi:hypothetical protein